MLITFFLFISLTLFARHGKSGRVCFLLPRLFIMEVLYSMVCMMSSHSYIAHVLHAMFYRLG